MDNGSFEAFKKHPYAMAFARGAALLLILLLRGPVVTGVVLISYFLVTAFYLVKTEKASVQLGQTLVSQKFEVGDILLTLSLLLCLGLISWIVWLIKVVIIVVLLVIAGVLVFRNWEKISPFIPNWRQ